MKKIFLLFLTTVLILVLQACAPSTAEDQPVTADNSAAQNMGSMRMGMRDNMMERHHATIPEAYAGLSNPINADEESLQRGAEIYATHCATCHGDGGMGDGPAGQSLDPVPAPIARTSQMLGDDYQFWRISEGGAMAPFNSGMIAWKGILDEQQRWDVINYVQALGRGTVMASSQMGGTTLDPQLEAENQKQMVAEAVAQSVITKEEAAVFVAAHEQVDAQIIQMRTDGAQGSMDDLMREVLAQLVAAAKLSQAEADTFLSVHDRLGEAGLMR